MAERSGDLQEVVADLAQRGLAGWPLVDAARRLIHDRFLFYSCLTWWESPATAYRRRRGYCAQYNGALAEVLHALGVECRLVHSFRVRVFDDPSWRMGHVWVQARVDGEVRDVCAGTPPTLRGRVGFEPLTRVRGFGPVMRAVTAGGMAPLVGGSLVRSAVTRSPRAAWLHRPWDR